MRKRNKSALISFCGQTRWFAHLWFIYCCYCCYCSCASHQPPTRRHWPKKKQSSSFFANPNKCRLPASSRSSAGDSGGEHATSSRCSKCDLRVLRFVDQRWSPDVDYMYFRNFMPNVDKMRAQLRSADGQCAFACQCTWTTVELGMPHGVGHWFVARS